MLGRSGRRLAESAGLIGIFHLTLVIPSRPAF